MLSRQRLFYIGPVREREGGVWEENGDLLSDSRVRTVLRFQRFDFCSSSVVIV
jgi:hypothetical protein